MRQADTGRLDAPAAVDQRSSTSTADFEREQQGVKQSFAALSASLK